MAAKAAARPETTADCPRTRVSGAAYPVLLARNNSPSTHAAAAARAADQQPASIIGAALRHWRWPPQQPLAGAARRARPVPHPCLPARLRQVFADERAPMRALFARLSAPSDHTRIAFHGYLAALPARLLVGQHRPPHSEPRSSTRPGRRLVARELESWRLLATGTPNPRIGKLVVTLDTVEEHVTSILGSFGTANPHQGRHAARQLRLVPDPQPAGPGGTFGYRLAAQRSSTQVDSPQLEIRSSGPMPQRTSATAIIQQYAARCASRDRSPRR